MSLTSPDPAPSVELTVPSVPRSVAEVRRFARDVCGTGSPVADTVELLVSEVATNALVHGAGDVRVRVVVLPGRVRVEVDDDSPHAPAPRSAGPTAEGGRGLALVTALSAQWGVLSRPGSKTVWFEVELPSRS